jgi:hypothetical protein
MRSQILILRQMPANRQPDVWVRTDLRAGSDASFRRVVSVNRFRPLWWLAVVAVPSLNVACQPES